MADRVMIFIDGSNLYNSLKSEFKRTDVSFAKLAECLTAGRELRRTYYYVGLIDQAKEPKPYQAQQRFLATLGNVPYFETRKGTLVYRNWPQERPIQKGVDVRLATDMLTHAFRNNFDVAILVSGDSDFADCLQVVKDQGKHVEVALFGPPTSSRRLREAADRVTTLDAKFLANCWAK